MAASELSRAGRAAKTGSESLFPCLLRSLDDLCTSREATQQGALAGACGAGHPLCIQP